MKNGSVNVPLVVSVLGAGSIAGIIPSGLLPANVLNIERDEKFVIENQAAFVRDRRQNIRHAVSPVPAMELFGTFICASNYYGRHLNKTYRLHYFRWRGAFT